MKKHNYILISMTAVVLLISSFQQKTPIDFIQELKEKLKSYNARFPEEKIYLQTDKTIYKPGEDIWFNAFVLNSNHQPTSVSDVAYVELINPKGQVEKRFDLPIIEGTAHGDLHLESSRLGGLYLLRAYTQWQKNFGPTFYFQKEVQVQHVITPRLLLKLDFEREAYGAGDWVSATLKVSNLTNQKVKEAGIRYQVNLNGKLFQVNQTTSDSEGNALLRFQLPDSLNTSDGLLQVVVQAEGKEESIARSIPIVLNKIALQFFPEGGTWIQGVPTTIAFKALNEYGKGADVSGVIINSQQQEVATFQSLHMGMGSFSLLAKPGEKYFARLTQPVTKQKEMELPVANREGLSLQLQSKSDSILQWSIYASEETEVYLIAQAHGKMVDSRTIKLKKGVNTEEVKTHFYPTGIVVFTLFDALRNGQCERLVFLKDPQELSIELKTDKPKYLPGEKVKLSITTLNKEGKPTAAKLSLATVDDQLLSYADDKQDNLLSAMFLTSEIRGEIQEPSFYFDRSEPKAAQALDHLMLTQGWRRFTWQQVTKNFPTISYAAEKKKDIRGMLVKGKSKEGFSGEVILLELNQNKRVAKLKTTKEGLFVFKNTDPTAELLLLTKHPGEIILAEGIQEQRSSNDKSISVGKLHTPEMEGIYDENTANETDGVPSGSFDLSLEADMTQLSEVVVTGYGVSERRSLTASAVSVNNSELSLSSMFPAPSIESALLGRVPGIQIINSNSSVGSSASIQLRGVASLNYSNEPLVVIDGFPVENSLNNNFSRIGLINPNDVQTIEIVKSAEAAALYGSRGSNGVILITTKSNQYNYHFNYKPRHTTYHHQLVSPRKFSSTREFYVPAPAKKKDQNRTDFRTTAYWNHSIVTNEKGEAEVSFTTTDAVTAFRIVAEGFSKTGQLGRKEEVLFTQLPVSLDVKFPTTLGYEDELRLPIRITNATSTALTGTLNIVLPAELSTRESVNQTIRLAPHAVETKWISITPNGKAGTFPIRIEVKTDDYNDVVNHIIQVQPFGFPMSFSFAAKDLDTTIPISLTGVEKNTLKAKFTAYPGVLNDVFAGLESVIAQPHGCFEQVSASTFPNILALQLLEQSGNKNPSLARTAKSYIIDGYKQLKAYEIKGGGFEWFGHPPAHEGLTAMGLLQFNEMKKVYSGVDDDMLKRTREWLISRRDGKGKFTQVHGKYGFAGSSEEVTNAYIVYALAETGTTDMDAEYKHALKTALAGNDMYRLALVANAAFALRQSEDFNTLIKRFKEEAKTSGLKKLPAERSMVNSYGKSLQVETISLWTLALLKQTEKNEALISECIQTILSMRSFGEFGSTQGTTLALKALSEYVRHFQDERESGEIELSINREPVKTISYQKEAHDAVEADLSSLFSASSASVQVRFKGTKIPLPYSLDVSWFTTKPASHENCKVELTSHLLQNKMKLNETVRQTIQLTNKTNEELPMTLAVIGIPAGLSAQPWQLKELQEKGVFDFYEITKNKLILYYRQMAPQQTNTINLDLKAEIPGRYTGAASSAFLYYNNEYKKWVAGETIEIE
ncbi:MAG: TonB-dependent receptor plug domain-containing protein [Cyclobacteriaceae bacterium]|nr:TonB-dependent receptor plug domain-containing protein [Cyclobacteriaceae bacterium]